MKNLFFMSIIILLLNGCSSVPMLLPEAAHVILTNNYPPKGVCQPKGGVSGRAYSYLLATNTALGARNDIKNQSFAVGANVVVLQTSQSILDLGTSVGLTMLGAAFDCSEVDWALNKPAGYK